MHPLKKAQRWLLKHGFTEFRPSAEFMVELAQLPEGSRRGIYVHAMKDGTEFYAGLSIDVVERYQQHLTTYATIEHSAFLHVPQDPLEPIESQVIKLLREKDLTLLNVLIPHELVESEDSDDEEDEEGEDNEDSGESEWRPTSGFGSSLAKPIWHVDDEPGVAYDPKELPKFANRYTDFKASRGYTPEIMEFVRYFVRAVLPDPVQSQKRYWSINCLTEAYRKESETTLVRISIYRPEIMAVHLNKDRSGSPYYFAFTLATTGGCDMADMIAIEKIPGITMSENPFKTARFNHIQLYAESLESAWEILRNPACMLMLKDCAARLMQNGKLMPRFAQAHCLPLAEEVFSQPATLPAKLSPPTVSDILANSSLDSVWLNEEYYLGLLGELVKRSAEGQPGALEALLRHAERHRYRDKFSEVIQELAERVKPLRVTHPELWKVAKALCLNSDTNAVAQAAYAACRLRAIESEDRLVMVRELLADLVDPVPSIPKPADTSSGDSEYSKAMRNRGAVLAGIMLTYDQEAIELAAESWDKLDKLGQRAFFMVQPEIFTFAYVNFLLKLLEGATNDTELQEAIVGRLREHSGLEHPIIQSVVFNFGMADGEHHHSIDPESWEYFAEHAERHADALREVGVKIGNAELIAKLLGDWLEWDAEETHEYLPDDYFTEDKE
jgi:hypothetical protein